MSMIQHPDFPRVEIPPMDGTFSYRNRWDEVMSAFREAGFKVREPPEQRRAESPCAGFAWFFVVDGLDRHHEVLVTDQPILPEREEAILRGAFSVVSSYSDAAFHIYNPDPLTPRMRTALLDTAAGRFLRRVGVEIPIGEIRPKGVPHVGVRIAEIMADCWNYEIDLDSAGPTLEWLDRIVMEYRSQAEPDDILPTPGAILTPPLAAMGIVVAELLRRHLPGPVKVHAAPAKAEAERQEDERLRNQDWAFVLAVAGGDELRYVYGPGRVFNRYCQGTRQKLVDLVPEEITHPESEEALNFVQSLPDDPSVT